MLLGAGAGGDAFALRGGWEGIALNVALALAGQVLSERLKRHLTRNRAKGPVAATSQDALDIRRAVRELGHSANEQFRAILDRVENPLATASRERYRSAVRLHRAGKAAEAVLRLRDALTKDPENADAHLLLGQIHLSDGAAPGEARAAAVEHFARAAEWAEFAGARARSDAERADYLSVAADAHHLAAVALLGLGSPAEALCAAERSAALRRSDALAFTVARCRVALGDARTARDEIAGLCARNPGYFHLATQDPLLVRCEPVRAVLDARATEVRADLRAAVARIAARAERVQLPPDLASRASAAHEWLEDPPSDPAAVWVAAQLCRELEAELDTAARGQFYAGNEVALPAPIVGPPVGLSPDGCWLVVSTTASERFEPPAGEPGLAVSFVRVRACRVDAATGALAQVHTFAVPHANGSNGPQSLPVALAPTGDALVGFRPTAAPLLFEPTVFAPGFDRVALSEPGFPVFGARQPDALAACAAFSPSGTAVCLRGTSLVGTAGYRTFVAGARTMSVDLPWVPNAPVQVSDDGRALVAARHGSSFWSGAWGELAAFRDGREVLRRDSAVSFLSPCGRWLAVQLGERVEVTDLLVSAAFEIGPNRELCGIDSSVVYARDRTGANRARTLFEAWSAPAGQCCVPPFELDGAWLWVGSSEGEDWFVSEGDPARALVRDRASGRTVLSATFPGPVVPLPGGETVLALIGPDRVATFRRGFPPRAVVTG